MTVSQYKIIVLLKCETCTLYTCSSRNTTFFRLSDFWAIYLSVIANVTLSLTLQLIMFKRTIKRFQAFELLLLKKTLHTAKIILWTFIVRIQINLLLQCASSDCNVRFQSLSRHINLVIDGLICPPPLKTLFHQCRDKIRAIWDCCYEEFSLKELNGQQIIHQATWQ